MDNEIKETVAGVFGKENSFLFYSNDFKVLL
jgi:hypothetical protein